jgi:hypothetical protein
MRAYRAAPRLAGALVPALLPSRSLLGRVHDLLTRVGSQVSGTTKVIAACAAGTASCVAIGVPPVPFAQQSASAPAAIERPSAAPSRNFAVKPKPEPARREHPKRRASPEPPSPVIESEAPEPVEYEPTPVEPAPEPESSGGSAAGEFGP